MRHLSGSHFPLPHFPGQPDEPEVRVWILLSHSFLCLVLLLVFTVAVFGRQSAIQVETAPVPRNLLEFMASGHAQVGKIYTVRRYEVLFQFLEFEATITNGLVEVMRSGMTLAASAPPLFAVLAILNVILVVGTRNTSEDL